MKKEFEEEIHYHRTGSKSPTKTRRFRLSINKGKNYKENITINNDNFENKHDDVFFDLLSKKFSIGNEFDAKNSLYFLKTKDKVLKKMFLDDSLPNKNNEEEKEESQRRSQRKSPRKNPRKSPKKSQKKSQKKNKKKNKLLCVEFSKKIKSSSKTLEVPDNDINKFSFCGDL